MTIAPICHQLPGGRTWPIKSNTTKRGVTEMTQTSKTGGGQGTNPYQIRGKSTGTNRRKNKPLVPMAKDQIAMATNE